MRKQKHKEIDLNYISGFVDGEGCITIIKTEPKRKQKTSEYKHYISVVNTDKKVLEIIQNKIDGKLNKVMSKQRCINSKWKQTYCLTWSNQKALKLCKMLHKRLIIKKKDAELIMEYYSKQPKRINGPTPYNELLRRDNLIKRLRR